MKSIEKYMGIVEEMVMRLDSLNRKMLHKRELVASSGSSFSDFGIPDKILPLGPRITATHISPFATGWEPLQPQEASYFS